MGSITKKIIYGFCLSCNFSCTSLTYLWEQGRGQMALLNRSRANEDVLKDGRVSPEVKAKIQKIAEYKRYFYQYFKRKETSTYSKTTLLDRPAVSYLVIASPYDKISARQECFPIAGCFPYLGFFDQGSAQKYAANLEQEGLETWIRPVYAYSTLGYFEDSILSSFFYYDDYELAELVFHELFHTIFFVKDEVTLNENMANYFAEAMSREYFEKLGDKNHHHYQARIEQDQKLGQINLEIVALAKQLEQQYRHEVPKTREQAQELRQKFLQNVFIPKMKQQCEQYKLSDKECFPLHRNWNNASLAALLTYRKKSTIIAELHKQTGGDLQTFFQYLEQRLAAYGKASSEKKFSNFLFSPMIGENSEEFASLSDI